MSKTGHRYRAGDLVGVIKDCMANCKILRRMPKKNGQGFRYVATAVKIFSDTPDRTFFGRNKTFVLPERRILLKLRDAWLDKK